MSTPSITLRELPGDYVIARLAPTTDLGRVSTACLEAGPFASVTRTPQELSLVCPAGSAPPEAEVDGPWVALYAAGPMPFGLTGVATSLVSPLSSIGCPVFVVSTFDGDVLMIPKGDAERARTALGSAGHTLL